MLFAVVAFAVVLVFAGTAVSVMLIVREVVKEVKMGVELVAFCESVLIESGLGEVGFY